MAGSTLSANGESCVKAALNLRADIGHPARALAAARGGAFSGGRVLTGATGALSDVVACEVAGLCGAIEARAVAGVGGPPQSSSLPKNNGHNLKRPPGESTNTPTPTGPFSHL